jgi:hypothetical protein
MPDSVASPVTVAISPNEQAAMKVLYPEATARSKSRENPTGNISNWKHTLNILTIHYSDRLTAMR